MMIHIHDQHSSDKIYFFARSKSKLLTIQHHQVSSGRIMQSICKVLTIPYKQLLARRNRLDGVEVDVHAILTCSQVLLLNRVCWIHITHPIAFFFIKSINEMEKFTTRIDLRKGTIYIYIYVWNIEMIKS